MKLATNQQELNAADNLKINIGVRAFPELKLKLSKDAKQLAVTLSEHCENILSNHCFLVSELEKFKKELEEVNKQNIKLREELNFIKDSNFNNENLILKRNNLQLLNKIKELNTYVIIFQDKRLLYLFDRVKGKNDIITTDQGVLNITFNSPKDVILALIYSYTI